ncbi:MAG: polysaccharide biosynthesis C-terminal domain-containing protein [Acidaminococcaceae bacterium]|nr:polysaccharide biosynthesis C-terminal domain-containing protein [Acidaminococcaceae bacterium]
MGHLTKSAIIVAVLMVLSKGLGLLREILLAGYFGTTYIVDAYSVACILPSVLFTLFASGFSNSYIPVLARIKNEKEKLFFFSNTTCILTAFSIVVSVLCFVFADLITKLIAPGFKSEAAILTEAFIKIIVFHLPFFTVFNIFCAQSAADEDFNFSNFCNLIVVNLIIIISIYFAYQNSTLWLAYGYVFSMIFATVMLGCYLYKRGKIIHFLFYPGDKNFLVLAKMAIPIGVSFLANQINAVADKIFSSTLGVGVTSALGYANRLQLLPYTLVVSVFVSICNPKMNRAFAVKDIDTALFYANKALMIAIYITFPIVLLLFFNAMPITMVLFQRGQFNSDSTIMTANCLKYYSLGMLFYAIRQIAANVLTANLKQQLILKNTITAVVTNVILNFLFIRFMGYTGLALSTSVAGCVAALLMLKDLKFMHLSLFNLEQVGDLIKIFGASITSIVLAKFTYCSFILLGFNYKITFFISVFIFTIVFIVLSVVFNVNIVIWLYHHIPNRFRLINKWN